MMSYFIKKPQMIKKVLFNKFNCINALKSEIVGMSVETDKNKKILEEMVSEKETKSLGKKIIFRKKLQASLETLEKYPIEKMLALKAYFEDRLLYIEKGEKIKTIKGNTNSY
jgi:hypothetical protein